MTQFQAEEVNEASVRATSRVRSFVLLAGAGFVAVVLVLSGFTSSKWEASALVGADSFEINRARIARTSAGLVRDSRLAVESDAIVQPIEETGLTLVQVVNSDRAQAEEDIDALTEVVLEDLNAVGVEVGSFVLVTDVTVRERTVGLRLSDSLFFLALATLSFGLAGRGLAAWVADDPTQRADEPS